MRVVVTGGGTGGHIYPALALCDALGRDSDITGLLYVGNRTSQESQLVPEQGIAFESIVFSGMPRRPGLQFIKWLLELKTAIHEAKAILLRFKPDVVFGTGGYVSAPVLFAAQGLKIPYLVHEPDAMPGLVNRLMSRWAQVATGAFEESGRYLKAKQFKATGNPVRREIVTLLSAQTDEAARRQHKADAIQEMGLPFSADKPIVLVVGGSQGARTLNRAIVDALPKLIGEMDLQIIHQAGGKLYEEALATLPEAYREHPQYVMLPYFQKMWLPLAMSDLAVCRSGSLTLSEMYLAGLPTVLVPYPYAASDHQRKNARASQCSGASLMLEDAECTGEALALRIQSLVTSPESLVIMRAACRMLSHPDATREIIALIKAQGKGNG